MKRLLLIGFAARTFALAPSLSASAMPSANLSALTTRTDSSIIQVHGWGHHGHASSPEGLDEGCARVGRRLLDAEGLHQRWAVG